MQQTIRSRHVNLHHNACLYIIPKILLFFFFFFFFEKLSLVHQLLPGSGTDSRILQTSPHAHAKLEGLFILGFTNVEEHCKLLELPLNIINDSKGTFR